MMKRIFDITTSILGILIISPIFIIVAILILITMSKPVFFQQKRIGKFGKPFRLYKFRTMSRLKDADSGIFQAGDISRTTSLGKLLRKTKIDELPQLINVIKGDMSIVGPRPEVEQWTKVYPEKWEIVHRVKPGITDNASVLFRNEEKILAASNNPIETYKALILPQKLELYIDYVNNNSFFGDLKLIFITLITIIIK